MPKVFISYRRSDSEDVTGRIYDRLCAHFGPENVFEDVDAIPLGADFVKQINDAVEHCDTVLAIIGSTWLGVTDESGARRLDNPKDVVRQEIEAGLNSDGVWVLPVLVRGARMPAARELPDSLSQLVTVNAAPIRSGRDFEHDVLELTKAIESRGHQPKRPLRKMLIAFVASVLIGGAFWAYRATGPITDASPPSREPIVADAMRQNSVAVLPFVNMSDDAGNEHFGDGISEELLHRLAQLSDLHVAARTSSFYFKGRDAKIQDIATQLGVRTVLEGSVRKSGDKIRVTAKLINASDGHSLWSENYDRELELGDIFTIQDEIAAKVVDALKLMLVPEDANRLRRHPTNNFDAYNAYLLGRQKLARRNIDALHESVEHFQKAIDLDVDYALAYVGLADAYALLHEYGDFLTADEMLARAQPLLTKAIVLDATLGEAYTSLGGLHRLRENYIDAEQAFVRAIELSPNYPTSHQWYGYLLAIQLGRVEEGLVQLRRARELDPISPIINKNLGDALVAAGEFEAGIEQFHKVMEIDASFPGSYQNLAATYRSAFGDLDESIVWLKKAIALDGQNPAYPSTLSQTYLDLGELDQARFWLDRSLDVAVDDSHDPMVAMMYLSLYENDKVTTRKAANDILKTYPRNHHALQVLRILDLEAGNEAACLDRILTAYGDLLESEDPLSLANHGGAVELAFLLRRSGDVDRALALENRVLAFTENRPRLGFGGYAKSDVSVYAMRGKTHLALEKLGATFSEGLRIRVWLLERDQIFDQLRTEGVYQTLISQVRTDLDEMRAAAIQTD